MDDRRGGSRAAPCDPPTVGEAARHEAGVAPGDSRVSLERFVARARHIECRVFADPHGRVVHGFDRECSIQRSIPRRDLKVAEEAPSVALDAALPARMGEAAVAAARTAEAVGGPCDSALLPDPRGPARPPADPAGSPIG